jgi:hypothetical protein
MAIYDPTNPPLFLSGTISSVISGNTYPYIDDTGLNAAGAKIEYTISVSTIGQQSVGTADVRTGNQKKYTAIDIKTGDWVSSTNGQICLQITSVISKTDSSIEFVAKDVDMITYKTYASSTFSNGSQIAFFEASDNGQPLITTSGTSTFFQPGAIDRIQGRFAAVEETERYRFEFETDQTVIDKGDTISINETSGDFVQFGSAGASNIPLGIVLEKTMGGRVVYIKPFNTIIDNHSNPELLTGSAGDVYYTDPSNPGKMTTTSSVGSQAILLHIKDAVPTIIESTVAGYLPTSGDSLIINDVVSYTGGVDPTPTSTQIFADLINLGTASHSVVASKNSIFAATTTGDGTGPTNGVVIVTITDDNGSSYTPVDVTIGDGTTSTTVTFDENTGQPLLALSALGASNYEAFTATEIATILNSEFIANSINLLASTVDSGNIDFPNLKISATNPTATINVTGTGADVLGDTFLTGTGVATSTSASSSDFLVLTRSDGGDVLITSSQGSYINTNGITSSSSGSPASLLMLEGAVSASSETGVGSANDLDQVPLNTTLDGDASGVFITYTPYQDSNVQIHINGIGSNLGNGIKTKDCWFSGDGGTTARLVADITSGDELHWNGSIAGYQLETTDEVDVIYDASSDDV